jgi:hypothetical protein
MTQADPFIFHTARRLVELTGIRARNLGELVTSLKQVSGSSIFYHTHHLYLQHHFEKPVFYNHFALWVSSALQEEPLAEKLAAIDMLSFTSIRNLRQAIIDSIEDYLSQYEGVRRECPAGSEFHFCKSKSFVMPTGIVAGSVPEFFERLPFITNVSLYFHFFEARLRLERATNDFSRWLRDMDEEGLAAAMERLNPYTMTLDELKREIMKLGITPGRGSL